jgi:integrase
VAEVSSDEIHNWLDAQKFECSPQNRKNNRKAISKLFAYAKLKGYCPTNTVRDVPPIKVPKKRPAILTADQIKTLLDGAPNELVGYIAVGAFAGLRPSEAQRLRWQEIREDGQIKVREDDNGADRFVAISSNLAAWLSLSRKAAGNLSPPEADRKLGNLARQLKLIRGNWTQDLLRHSYGTAHICLLNDLAKTAFEMGNSPATVKAKYLNAISQSDALKWWQVMPSSDRKRSGEVFSRFHPEAGSQTDSQAARA